MSTGGNDPAHEYRNRTSGGSQRRLAADRVNDDATYPGVARLPERRMLFTPSSLDFRHFQRPTAGMLKAGLETTDKEVGQIVQLHCKQPVGKSIHQRIIRRRWRHQLALCSHRVNAI